MTSRFPAIVAVVLGLDCTSVVLDGEVIGVRGADDRPEPFQDTMSRFGRHGDPAPSLVVRFFDCLHLDGDDLVDRPLVDRAAVLERLAPRHRVPSIVTADGAEAQAFFEQSLAAGHEGVMVKGASSLYEAGRRGGLWRKVKPVVTFDLVVLGAEWGHGRRRGWLSNLHLGARDPDATGPDEGFVMVGKTFKGLTDELLAWQTERFLELEVSRSDHAVVTRPELVVEIAVDGVQRSTRYGGGVTLRFARVRRYRPDKHVGQSDTIASLRGLLAGN